LKKAVKVSKLNLDLSSYDKREISDLVGIFNYVSEDLGEYYTGTSDTIRSIWLFPSREQEMLNCKTHK